MLGGKHGNMKESEIEEGTKSFSEEAMLEMRPK